MHQKQKKEELQDARNRLTTPSEVNDDFISSSTMTASNKTDKPYQCLQCHRQFDVGTKLVDLIHDHNNTDKDRHYICKGCKADQSLVYVTYQKPNIRIFGVHCEKCFI